MTDGPDSAGDLVPLVLYRDGLVIVLNKPAGINVHAGPRDRHSLEANFESLRFGLPRPPVLAHRLDRDTSGCLALARHPKAARRLGRLFAEGRVDKRYWAVVRGVPADRSGRIALALGKVSHRTTGWRMVPDKAGKPAITDYQVLAVADGLALLELMPRTGRTHQVRVHCAALGCPILGDPQYGAASDARIERASALASGSQDGGTAQRLHLHASSLRLPLYANRPAIDVTAPVPTHFEAIFAALGFRPNPLAP